MARIRKPPGPAEHTPAQRAARDAVQQSSERYACSDCNHTSAWHGGGGCAFPGCKCRAYMNRGRRT